MRTPPRHGAPSVWSAQDCAFTHGYYVSIWQIARSRPELSQGSSAKKRGQADCLQSCHPAITTICPLQFNENQRVEWAAHCTLLRMLSTYVPRLAAGGRTAAGGGEVSAAPVIGHSQALCQEKGAAGFEWSLAAQRLWSKKPPQIRERACTGLVTTISPDDWERGRRKHHVTLKS